MQCEWNQPPYRNQYGIPHDKPSGSAFHVGAKWRSGKIWEDWVEGWMGCAFVAFALCIRCILDRSNTPQASRLAPTLKQLGQNVGNHGTSLSLGPGLWFLSPCDSDLAEQGSRHGCHFWFQHSTIYEICEGYPGYPRVNTWEYRSTNESYTMYDSIL